MAEQNLGGNGNGQMLLKAIKKKLWRAMINYTLRGHTTEKCFFFNTISINLLFFFKPKLPDYYQESKWIVNKKNKLSVKFFISNF